MDNSTNPISTAQIDPRSIADLFEEDPKNLTKEDRLRIVKEIRSRRDTYFIAKAKAKAAGKRTPGTKAGVTLEDLGKKAAVMDDLDDLLNEILPSKSGK